jgi:hypothetical protein
LNLLAKIGLLSLGYLNNYVFEYQEMASLMANKPKANYTWLRCITPSFDNSPRRQKAAVIAFGSTPEKYEAWLKKIARYTNMQIQEDKRIIFLNAWNEWGESNHLEPDQKWGKAYLEATLRAINGKDEIQNK